MTRFLPRAVLAAAGVLSVVVTALTLQRDTSRVLGSNGIPPVAFVVSVPSGERACQSIPEAPAGTSALRMTVGVYHDPRARLRVDVPGATVGKAAAARDGVMELPAAGAAGASRICVANVGAGRVELAGAQVAREESATVGPTRAGALFGVSYLEAEADTWGEQSDEILARVGYAKGLPGGSATGALLVVLLVLMLAGSLALSWRHLRP